MKETRRDHEDAGSRLVRHADEHLVDARLPVDADEATGDDATEKTPVHLVLPEVEHVLRDHRHRLDAATQVHQDAVAALWRQSAREDSPRFVHMLTSSTSIPFSFASPRPAYHRT